MSKDWHSLYRDPRWQKKRLEVLERAEWHCENCGDSESELQVHHGFYESNRKPWEYEPTAYFALCESCHEEGDRARRLIKSAGMLPLEFQIKLADLIQVLQHSDCNQMITATRVIYELSNLLVYGSEKEPQQ